MGAISKALLFLLSLLLFHSARSVCPADGRKPFDNGDELRAAVLCLKSTKFCDGIDLSIYNPGSDGISGWCVGQVTDFDGLFEHYPDFNTPIGDWDVSQATTMVRMFWGTSVFNQDLSNWNVSKVTNMNEMFLYASSFNQDLCRWGEHMLSDGSIGPSVSRMFTWSDCEIKDLPRVAFEGDYVDQLCVRCMMPSSAPSSVPTASPITMPSDGLIQTLVGGGLFALALFLPLFL